MADEAWRKAERDWKRDPRDLEVARRAIAAMRRAGVPVPGDLLELQRLPATRFASKRAFHVFVETPEGEVREVGTTPGSVDVPESREWWVRPRPAKVTPWLVKEVENVPGLSMERAKLSADGVAEVARLEHLTWLSLETCTNLGDAELKPLQRMGELDTLDLSGVKGLRGEGLRLLEGMRGLVRLRLARIKSLKDADAEPLARLGQLARLSLLMTGIGDAGLAHVGKLRELTHLDLSYDKRISDKGVRELAGLGKLRDLSLASCEKLTDVGALSGLPLETLNLHMCRKLTPATVAGLANVPLRRVDFSSNESGALVPAIAKIATLREVDLAYTAANDDELGALARLPGLRRLQLRQAKGFGAGGLAAFAGHAALEELYLGFCSQLDDAAARELARIPGLRVLHLPYAKMTDAGVAALAALRELRNLSVAMVSITDAAIAALDVPLETLALGGTKVTGVGLGRFRKLRWLDLSHAPISDAGLREVASLPDLEVLDLSRVTTVTDAGIAALKEARKLKSLDLTHTGTGRGVEAVARAFPGGVVRG